MITPALVARAETLCTEAMPEAEKGRTWVDNVAKASAVGACLLASFLFGVECCSRLLLGVGCCRVCGRRVWRLRSQLCVWLGVFGAGGRRWCGAARGRQPERSSRS
eukprot:1690257-Rhodomonas_salina.1